MSLVRFFRYWMCVLALGVIGIGSLHILAQEAEIDAQPAVGIGSERPHPWTWRPG